MKDRHFLIWVHQRLELVYGDRPLVDFMHKLRAIIADYPKDKETPNDGRGKNGLKELLEELVKEDESLEDILKQVKDFEENYEKK